MFGFEVEKGFMEFKSKLMLWHSYHLYTTSTFEISCLL
jgi:hypothetical protein